MDRRGPLSKHGPRYLRWGLMEAAIHASSHPLYKERYQRTKRRLGRQRGAKVAQIELARKLTEAIWYMLTRNQPFKPFAPEGAISRLSADSPFLTCAAGASPDNTWSSKSDEAIETWALLHTITPNPPAHRDNLLPGSRCRVKRHQPPVFTSVLLLRRLTRPAFTRRSTVEHVRHLTSNRRGT